MRARSSLLAPKSPGCAALALLGTLFLLVSSPAAASNERVTFRSEGRGWGPLFTQSSSYKQDAVWDLNGDGAPDLLAPDDDSIDVSVNRGDGTFFPVVKLGLPSGIQPGSPAVGDINCDGKPDIVVGDDNGPNTFSVFLGNGDGTFQPRQAFPAGAGFPDGIAIGDLNCDGQADVVCGVNVGTTTYISVILNSGCGTMQPPVLYASPGVTEHLYLMDVNGDGITDVVMGSQGFNSGISVYLGNGDGTLRMPRIDTFVTNYSAQIAFGDWNRDGLTDVAWVPATPGPVDSIATMIGLGDGTFALESEYYVGGRSLGLAAGDVNEDGIADLVCQSNDRIHVLRGLGNGAFVTPPIVTTTIGADGNKSILLADVDRDGHLDEIDEALGVRHGNGDGTFGSAPTYAVPPHPRAACAADLNGDLLPDLVVVTGDGLLGTLNNAGAGIMAGLETQATGGAALDLAVTDVTGDGKPDAVVCGAVGTTAGFLSVHPGIVGGFGAPITTPLDTFSVALAVGDLNGDGKPDIVLSGRRAISVRLGTGSGSFGAPIYLSTANIPSAIAMTDLNEDGKKDIVVVHQSNNGPTPIEAFLGNGNGTFAPGVQVAYSPSSSIIAMDLTGDGHVDLMVDGARVYPGLGDGTVGAPIIPPVSVAPPALSELRVADFDLDGIPDVIGTAGFGKYWVLLGNGDGTFQLGGEFLSYMAWANYGAVVVADWNQDGRPDFATLHYDEGRVMVNMNRGPGVQPPPHGVFAASTDYATGPGAIDLAVADFNGDGRPDVATPSAPSDSVSVLLGNASGGLGPPSYWVAGHPHAVTAGDVNRDGKPDLVTASFGPNPNVSVLLGNGNGTFQPPLSTSFSQDVEDVAIGDVNHDGIPDLVVAGAQPVALSVMLGHGDGTFEPPRPQQVATNCTYYEVKLANMNQDCRPDLVAVTGECTSVEVLLALPGGGFAPGVSYSLGDEAYTVVVGDFNKDGNLDVAAPTTFGGVAVLLGSPSGTLGSPTFWPSGEFPDGHASVGDVDNDGNLDIVVSSPENGTVTILRGHGDGTFSAPETHAIGSPYATALADWNHDGNLDIGVARALQGGGSVVSLLLNGTGPVAGAPAQAAAPRATLAQNAPNPFNPSTTIRFSLAQAGPARLIVYDVRGRKVATLLDRPLPAGEERVRWNGEDDAGRAVSSGVYFYRLSTASGPAETRKMVLAK